MRRAGRLLSASARLAADPLPAHQCHAAMCGAGPWPCSSMCSGRMHAGACSSSSGGGSISSGISGGGAGATTTGSGSGSINACSSSSNSRGGGGISSRKIIWGSGSGSGSGGRSGWSGQEGGSRWQHWAVGASAAAAIVMAAPLAAAADAKGPSPNPGAANPNPNQPLTNHPLELDPVTNEHTAQMTLARAAALEYYQAGKYAKAEAKFKEALEEAIKGFDAKDPHIASAKNNLAEFYRNTKQYVKAEPLYIEALDLLDTIYGQKHWLYVSTKHNLALMYEADGQYKKAFEQMQEVLDLRLKLFGDRSFLYADSMFALAHIARKLGGKGADERAVKLMTDAIAILEDAESVQVNVVVFWLEDLAALQRQLGRQSAAAECLKKALHYMEGDKGQVMAQASALADQLIDTLLEVKPLDGSKSNLKEARDVAEACVAARTVLFKKDLAVVAAMLKLATIEGQLGQASALQHASNAAALAQEIQSDLSKSSGWGAWVKGNAQGQKQGVKRVRAGHLLGSSLKLLATLQQQVPGGSGAEGAESALRGAAAAFQAAADQAEQQLQAQLNSPSSGQDPGMLDELTSLFVETMLSRIECLERLSQLLKQQGDATGAQQAQQGVEEASAKLMAMT